MNYSIYRFTLDIHKTKSQVSIPVLYHDTAIQFYISLTDGGKPYYIEDGCRAVFSAKKPDGTELFNDCIIEDNTRIRYDFTKQTTNSEGIMDCEIRLYGTDGHLITTPAFVVVVDPRVIYDSDIIESHPESTSLDNIISSELSRLDAEASRVAAENARVAAEVTRIVSETERVDAETERTDAEAERKANEAERMKAYASMIGSWVAYSLYPDGTDYTWEWSEGQRYIGLCNGKTPPKSKEDFVWSKFVDTGIYIGSGDMPEWCDLQIDPEGDATEIVQTTGQSDIDVMSQKAVSNTFANALKGSASGEVVALNDVSPIEHEMGVSVRNKNLIPYPYYNTTKTTNGITFTDNGDGTITANGTAEKATSFVFTKNITLENGKYYTISGTGATLAYILPDGTYQYLSANKSIIWSSNYTFVHIYYNVAQGKTLDNVIVPAPQLEEGTTATAYAPYIEDISAVTVSAMGKNLFTFDNMSLAGSNADYISCETGEGWMKQTFSRDVTGSQYMAVSFNFYPPKEMLNKPLIISADFESDIEKKAYIKITNKNGKAVVDVWGKTTKKEKMSKPIQLDGEEGDLFLLQFQIVGDAAIQTTRGQYFKYSNMQIEVANSSNTATGYEPYIEPVTYPVSADGMVQGVKSIYPSTTLLANTAGAVIDCSYNKDANKALDDIITRISALEAAVL